MWSGTERERHDDDSGVAPRETVYLWERARRTPQVAQMRALGRLFELCSDKIELPTGGPDTVKPG